MLRVSFLLRCIPFTTHQMKFLTEKSTFYRYGLYLVLVVSVNIVQGCHSDGAGVTPANSTIYGLWTGTYTVSATDPTYVGKSFFFSFTIYDDGTLTYKSKTPGSDVYAYGTWSLSGNTFSFKVTTLNYDGGYQHTQLGNATFISSQNTLSDGTITDSVTGGKSSWTMKREN